MRICGRCGTKLAGLAGGGLCPKCFLEEGLAPPPEPTHGPHRVAGEDAAAPERIPEARVGAQGGLLTRLEAATKSSPSVTEKAGDQIGRYKLLQVIGEGGCGVVYLAEQETPIRRRVAFKVIKLGMDTRQVVARFEAERQALALMDHPGIAKVLDAGATEIGRPYFVMELVRGSKITEYCDQNQLSTEARLHLFIQVCHAIHHAHQKGIIHRDIKPSNILVALQDGKPVAKVIDFGIAKATEQPLTDKTLFTAFDQFMGTPAYMSPEQVGPGGLDIDTRSDIYSLGVLLYELLTGHTPFETGTLSTAGRDEMLRIIREEQPARPSTRYKTLAAEEQTTLARQRQAEAPKLFHQLRGDLDWIVLKTLEKDRSRRYDTAKDLAADVQRHLEHVPVLARPPELWYLTRKFLRRRRRPVVAVASGCVLIAAAVAIGFQQKHTHALREAAQTALFRQEESEIVGGLIAATVPPAEPAARQFKACVARLSDRIRKGDGSSTDCELLARVMTLKVGWIGPAIQKLEEPHLKLRAGLGRWNVQGLGAVVVPTISVGASELRPGGWEGEADALYVDGWGSDSLTTGMIKPIELRGLISKTGRYRISGMLTVHLVKAQGRKEQPIRDHIKLADYAPVGIPVRLPLPALDITFLDAVPSEYPVPLADAPMFERLRGGIVVQEAWIAFDADPRGQLHLELFYPYSNDSEPKFPIALDCSLVNLNGAAVADRNPLLGRRAYGGGGATVEEFTLALPEGASFPPGPRPVRGKISIQSSRAVALAEGLDQFLSFPEIQKEISIEVRRDGNQEGKQSLELVRQGKLGEAEALLKARLDSLRAFAPADDPLLAHALSDLAYTLLCQQRFVAAEPLATECLGILEKQMPENWRTFAARSLLGAALLGQNRHRQAAPLLVVAYEGLNQRAKWIPPDQKKVQLALPLARLAQLYSSSGQLDRAIEHRRQAAESADLQTLNSLAWFLATRRNSYERDGKTAVVLAERVVAATERKQPFVLDTLAAAYAEAGEFGKAISTQREAMALLNDPREKGIYSSRLTLYQSGTPCREP